MDVDSKYVVRYNLSTIYCYFDNNQIYNIKRNLFTKENNSSKYYLETEKISFIVAIYVEMTET